MSISTLITLCLIGVGAGVLSGTVGVGGGIIMVPAMVMLLGLTQHEAQGTSIFAMLPPIGILAAMNYYKSGHIIKWEYAVVIALSFIIGGYFGSKIAVSLDQATLKKIFGIIMLIGAIKMLFGK